MVATVVILFLKRKWGGAAAPRVEVKFVGSKRWTNLCRSACLPMRSRCRHRSVPMMKSGCCSLPPSLTLYASRCQSSSESCCRYGSSTHPCRLEANAPHSRCTSDLNPRIGTDTCVHVRVALLRASAALAALQVLAVLLGLDLRNRVILRFDLALRVASL